MFSEFSRNSFSGNGKNFTTITPVHYVKPHYVKSYFRNGSYIAGFWRDGDGNTCVDRNTGYIATNPNTITKLVKGIKIKK